MTPEEVANLRRLTDEFQNELKQLGMDMANVNKRLDALAKDVADINARLDRMPQFYGNVFWGFRSDRSRYGFIDKSGALRSMNPSHVSNVDSDHDFQLGVHANIPGGGKFTGEIVFSNYLVSKASGAGGGFTRAPSFFQPGAVALGGPAAANANGLPEQVTLYQARLDYPIGGFGSNTMLTLGRFKNQVTPLTYQRNNTDAYFDLPWYPDGNYIQDGFRIQSKFGSATTQLWAGSYSSLTSTSAGGFINKPVVGSLESPRRGIGGFKPFNLESAVDGGAIFANQGIGLHVGIPFFKLGEVGATIEDFTVGPGGVVSPVGPGATPGFGNVAVYGANLTLNPIGRLHLEAEGAKSVTQIKFDQGDTRNNDDDNAFTVNAGWASGPLNINAGYKYIDPRFAAPGDWGHIGNWYNPTNIRGPYLHAGYALAHNLSVHLGGDFYEGARNRAGIAGAGTGWTMGSSAVRGLAGVKYSPMHNLSLTADYEGVFWSVSPAVSVSGLRAKPVEQYITVGAGLNLTANTVLKMAYQIINFQDVGGGFTAFTPGGTSNASVFTTQVAVHF